MLLTMLKSKIHQATVTIADLNYEGSISIDPQIYETAKMLPNEKVDIYNITTGARFSTYIIPGKEKEIGLNGAAARMVQPGDQVIIASYVQLTDKEALTHQPKVLLMNSDNEIKSII